MDFEKLEEKADVFYKCSSTLRHRKSTTSEILHTNMRIYLQAASNNILIGKQDSYVSKIVRCQLVSFSNM